MQKLEEYKEKELFRIFLKFLKHQKKIKVNFLPFEKQVESEERDII